MIVKNLSRFGRNYLEVGDYLEHLFLFLGVRFIAVNDHCDSQDNVGSMEYRSGKLSRDGFMVKKTEQVKEAEDLVLLFKEAKAAYEKYQEEGLEKKETEE